MSNYSDFDTTLGALAEALLGKADIATTVSGYGITDVYTKGELDLTLGDIDSALTAILS